LAGTAEPTGAIIAVQDQAVLGSRLIEENSGKLCADKSSVSIPLSDLDLDGTLFCHLSGTSGDLKPILSIRHYSKKPIRIANPNGKADNPSFEQDFPDGVANFSLDIIVSHVTFSLKECTFRCRRKGRCHLPTILRAV
jgi:hypothetical protein